MNEDAFEVIQALVFALQCDYKSEILTREELIAALKFALGETLRSAERRTQVRRLDYPSKLAPPSPPKKYKPIEAGNGK